VSALLLLGSCIGGLGVGAWLVWLSRNDYTDGYRDGYDDASRGWPDAYKHLRAVRRR
jgi:hypothetical protein